jgi:hypothetical protein
MCNSYPFFGAWVVPKNGSWDTLRWLFTTAYSIPLQLPSISGGHVLHQQLENVPYCGDRGPTLHGCEGITLNLMYSLWH